MNTKSSRRSFIKRSSLAAAGVVAGNLLLSGLVSAEEGSRDCLESTEEWFLATGSGYLTDALAMAAGIDASENTDPYDPEYPNTGYWHQSHNWADGPCEPLNPPKEVPPGDVQISITTTQGFDMLWSFTAYGSKRIYHCRLLT